MNQKEQAGKSSQQKLTNVGDNLYRSDQTGIYYSIFKRGGKQIRRSLKTTDRQLALRKLAERRGEADKLDTSEAAKIAFAVFDAKGEIVGGLLRQYIDNKLASMKPRTLETNLADTKSFARWFADKPARNISLGDVEKWAAQHQKEVSAETFNRHLGLLRRIFAYAKKHGIRLDNPADEEHIDRAEPDHKKVIPPTHEEFAQLVAEIRKYSNEAADFVEAMGYSGCRVSEIGGRSKYGYPPLYWNGEKTMVNFKGGTFTVVGKGQGKERKSRTVPLFPPFRDLLLRRRARLAQPPQPTDRVFEIESPRMSMQTACKSLGWHPKRFTPHDCRHFFCSNAIELGFDFMVIAAWLGHSDGGKLVMSTYGHLRPAHSMALAARMTWSVDQKPPTNIVDMPANGTANSKDDNEGDQHQQQGDNPAAANG